jgi:putative endonuclease
MIFFVYILYSPSLDSFYTGQTEDLEIRIANHLAGESAYTKKAKDRKLVWSQTFPSRTEAIKFERFIKKQKSKAFIRKIISQNASSS